MKINATTVDEKGRQTAGAATHRSEESSEQRGKPGERGNWASATAPHQGSLIERQKRTNAE